MAAGDAISQPAGWITLLGVLGSVASIIALGVTLFVSKVVKQIRNKYDHRIYGAARIERLQVARQELNDLLLPGALDVQAALNLLGKLQPILRSVLGHAKAYDKRIKGLMKTAAALQRPTKASLSSVHAETTYIYQALVIWQEEQNADT